MLLIVFSKIESPEVFFLYLDKNSSENERIAFFAVNVVSVRAELLSLEEKVEDISTDKYVFVRDAFLDRREFLIHDGNPPVDESLYEGLDDEG